MKRVFSIDPANEHSKDMFYSDNDQEHRCIGHLQGDFGASGEECWTSFWPHEGAVLTGADCRDEINALVEELRKDLFKSRTSMRQYIRQHPPLVLESGEITVYGYQVKTEKCEYYIRCTPHSGCYDFYVYCYLREAGKYRNC